MLPTPITTERLNGSESERWFRAIFENDPQCLMILSVDGQLLDINPTGLTMLEADSAAPLIGRELQHLLAPQSRGSFAKVLEGVRKGSARLCHAQILSRRARILGLVCEGLRSAVDPRCALWY